MTKNTLIVIKLPITNDKYYFDSFKQILDSNTIMKYDGPIKLFAYLYSYTEVLELTKFLMICQNSVFKLAYLCCNDCEIKTLISLPDTLETLACGNNKIKSLPDLPTKLTELLCSKNKLTILPPLPLTLVKLCCNNNMIKNLPNLPHGLMVLSCANNLIDKLPNLPETLINLDCSNNKLEELPNVPDSLIYMNCSYNQLTSVPKLSSKLEICVCISNKIRDFPSQIPQSLRELNMSNNRLTDLHKSIIYSKINKLQIYNNPICLKIMKLHSYNNYMNMTKIKNFIQKRAVDKIGDWYLEIKYNPKYKYCQNRLQKEFEELYN